MQLVWAHAVALLITLITCTMLNSVVFGGCCDWMVGGCCDWMVGATNGMFGIDPLTDIQGSGHAIGCGRDIIGVWPASRMYVREAQTA